MTKEERDIQRKLRVLRHAKKTSHVARTCRYFGIGRSTFYRWKAAYDQCGEAGLISAKPIPTNPANQTPPEIVKKGLYLRSQIAGRYPRAFTHRHCVTSGLIFVACKGRSAFNSYADTMMLKSPIGD